MAAAEKLFLNIIEKFSSVGDWFLIEEFPEGSLEKVVKDVCNEFDLKGNNDLTNLRIAIASLGAIVEAVNLVLKGDESGMCEN